MPDEFLSESEKALLEWYESINFVDKDGNVIEPVLEEDDSPDPEGDRE